LQASGPNQSLGPVSFRTALSHTVVKHSAVKLQSALNIPCNFGAHGIPHPRARLDASSESFAPRTRARVYAAV
jgi:hypothetical protein